MSFLSFGVPNKQFFAPVVPEFFPKRQLEYFRSEYLWSQVTMGEYFEIVQYRLKSFFRAPCMGMVLLHPQTPSTFSRHDPSAGIHVVCQFIVFGQNPRQIFHFSGHSVDPWIQGYSQQDVEPSASIESGVCHTGAGTERNRIRACS
jgi:hypothetical protein